MFTRSLRAAALAAPLCLAGAAVAQDTARLSALHGVAGLPAPVDVFVNGELAFSFEFLDQVGPLELPVGDYDLEVQLDGNPVLMETVSLSADTDYSVIAHQTFIDGDSGGLKLSVFENDADRAPLDGAKATVRHTADAPAVDILIGQDGNTVLVIENLSNDDSGTPGEAGPVTVPAGEYSVGFAPTGTNNIVFSTDVQLDPSLNYAVYAVGSIFDGSFTLLPQIIQPLGCDLTDLDANGSTNIIDFIIFIRGWARGDVFGDVNFDGAYNIHDVIVFLRTAGQCWNN